MQTQTPFKLIFIGLICSMLVPFIAVQAQTTKTTAKTTVKATTPAPAKCISRYTPFYNGTCISPSICTGAIIEGRCGSSTTVKCCLPENTGPSSPNAILSGPQMAKILGFQNARTDAISRYLYYPKSKQSCFNRATYVSVFAVKTDSFMMSEERATDAELSKSDFLYGNNGLGEGGLYRARGFAMIKGKALYKLASEALNLPALVTNPELAAFPAVGSRIAAWYWGYRNYEPLADGTYVSFSQLMRLFFGSVTELNTATKMLEGTANVLKCGKIVKGHINSDACKNEIPGGLCKPLCVKGGDKEYCGCNGQTYNDLCPGYASNIKCCLEKCSGTMDLTFVLDSSGSITASEFNKVRNFTGEIISRLDIGEMSTRVAVINYGTDTQVITNLKTTFDREELLKKVKAVPYLNSGTNTRKALEKCRDTIYKTENGMRPIESGVSKVMIVLTDGKSQDKPGPVALQLKLNNINIISIGVTGAIDFEELEEIASFGKVFLLEDFDQVLFVIDDMLELSCKEPAVIPDVTEVIEVEQNNFKYLRFSIENFNTSYIALNVEQVAGKVEIFYSFENRNPNDFEVVTPKPDFEIDPWTDNATYVKPKVRDPFYKPDAESAHLSRLALSKSSTTQTKVIAIPQDKNYTTIYIGIKGLAPTNEFKLVITESEGNAGFSLHSRRSLFIYVISFITFYIAIK